MESAEGVLTLLVVFVTAMILLKHDPERRKTEEREGVKEAWKQELLFLQE